MMLDVYIVLTYTLLECTCNVMNISGHLTDC